MRESGRREASQADGQKILVIGGAGYIGSHTAKLLRKEGHHPILLDDLSTGHRAAAASFNLIEGSYDDEALVERVLGEHSIQTVMHFGAKALVEESVRDPLLYFRANVAGTISLLSAMRRVGVRELIFSSTCATFGVPTSIPINERCGQNPINPYGRSKLMVEQMLRELAASHGLRSAVLRYFNAAGADPEGELGEDHNPETHLIPQVLRVALGREPALRINGTDYPTPDGSCVRDYVHVNDLARAHIRAMQKLAALPISTEGVAWDFNLGSEKGYSVLEIVAMVEKVTGLPVKREPAPRRVGDPPALIADASLAWRELGWRPEHDLEQIINSAYQWMKRHPNGYED